MFACVYVCICIYAFGYGCKSVLYELDELFEAFSTLSMSVFVCICVYVCMLAPLDCQRLMVSVSFAVFLFLYYKL